MMAPNIQLDIAVREPVQDARSVRPSGAASDTGGSSFLKELERAMGGKNEPGEALSEPQGGGMNPVRAENEAADAVAEDAPRALSGNPGALSGDALEEILSGLEKSAAKGLVGAGLVRFAEDESGGGFPAGNSLGDAAAGMPEAVAGLPTDGIVSRKAAAFDAAEVSVLPPDGLASAGQTDGKTDDAALDEELLLATLQAASAVESAVDPAAVSPDDVAADFSVEARPARLDTGTVLDGKISVMDYRSAAESGVSEGSLKDGNFTTAVSYGDGSADITFSLAAGPDNSASASAAEKTGESRFASMLSSQLQSNAGEFVKSGSIILRDGNAGTINLILHPQELGNVRISLEMRDRLVSAQITVASEEAFQAFRESIPALKQAFAESGFQTGGFDLAWSGGGQGGSASDSNGDFARQRMLSLARAAYGEVYADDEQADSFLEREIYSDLSRVAVNIMA